MRKLYILFVFIFIYLSCNKSEVSSDLNCSNLISAFINYDTEKAKIEIEKITTDLTPNYTYSDQYGQLVNFNILIDRLMHCTSLYIDTACYRCIETNPPISIIKIELDSLDHLIYRSIEIMTPEDDTMSFSRISEINP